MGFKKLRGVSLPEEKQGLIRYTCLTWDEQPQYVQKKIRLKVLPCGRSCARNGASPPSPRPGLLPRALCTGCGSGFTKAGEPR